MFVKLLLKIIPFTLLIYNISDDMYASNTSDTSGNTNINKNKVENNKINKNNSSNEEDSGKNINEDQTDNKEKNNKDGEYDNNDNEDTSIDASNDNIEDNNTEDSEDEDKINTVEDKYSIDEKNDNNNKKEDSFGEDDDNNSEEKDNIDDDTSIEDEFEDNMSDNTDDGNEDNDIEDLSENENEDAIEDPEDDENDNIGDLDEENYDDDTEDDNVYDPLEKINRKVFKFNDTMDNVLSKIMPKNKHRDRTKPSPVLTVMNNFSHNFFEAPRIINYALQGNIKNASNSIARLMINTAFGFFGVADVAEKLGFKKNNTYFGDTLKKWGMKPGPYVVLPILGPTSLRGAVGHAFGIPILHTAKLPLRKLKPIAKNTVYYTTYCGGLLATRSAYGEMIEQVSAMSKDKYKTFRSIIMSSEGN